MNDEAGPEVTINLTRDEGLRQEEKMWKQVIADLPPTPRDSSPARNISSTENTNEKSDQAEDDEIHTNTDGGHAIGTKDQP